MNPRVKAVETEDDYKLRIVFTDDSIGVFDCNPYLEIGVFKELQDSSYFNQVKVHDGTVTWPHKQDFCPDTIYLESVKLNQSTSA